MDIEKTCSKFIKKLKKDDYILIGLVFLFGFLNYFYFMTNNALSADGMFNGPIYFAGGWEVDLGRPLLVLIDKLKFGIVNVPIIIFFSLLYMSATVLIIKRIFKIKKLFPMILITLILVLFPVFAESATCIYCFDSYMFSMLLATLALYFIDKKKFMPAVIFIVASLAIYQAYISVTIVGIVMLFILDVLNNKGDFKRLFINLFFVFIGLLSYFLILKGTFLVFHRSFADYKGASSFGFISLIQALPSSILNCYQDFFYYFVTNKVIYNTYYYRHIINTIIIFIFLFSLIKPFLNLNLKNKIYLILSFAVLPICVNIMDIIASSTTITLMTGVGYLFIYILIIIIIYNFLSINLLKSVSFVLLCVLSYTFLLSNNSTFMARNEVYNNFYYECNQLINKIKNIDGYDESYQIMINDVFRYNSDFVPLSNGFLALQYETFENHVGLGGYSNFYKRYFGENITMVDKNKYLEIVEKDAYKDMEIGDIKIIDNVIVAKISDNIIYE